jgi:hypothetical protein
VREPQRQVGKVEFLNDEDELRGYTRCENHTRYRTKGILPIWDSIYCQLRRKQFSTRLAHPAAFPERPRITREFDGGLDKGNGILVPRDLNLIHSAGFQFRVTSTPVEIEISLYICNRLPLGFGPTTLRAAHRDRKKIYKVNDNY